MKRGPPMVPKFLPENLLIFSVSAEGTTADYCASRSALDTSGLLRDGERRIFPEILQIIFLHRRYKKFLEFLPTSIRCVSVALFFGITSL